MIWFSAEFTGISIKLSACGPIAIPASRKIAISGIRIFRAKNPAIVPIARITPQLNSVCLEISIEAGGSTWTTPKCLRLGLIQRPQPGADFARCDMSLLLEHAHGEETAELPAK